MKKCVALLLALSALALGARLPEDTKERELIRRARQLDSIKVEGGKVSAADAAKIRAEAKKIDIDQIFNNKKFMKFQIRCILGQGPCDQTGKDIKLHLQTVMQGDCEQCTEEEIKEIRRMLKKFKDEYADDYKAIEAKYAPNAPANVWWKVGLDDP